MPVRIRVGIVGYGMMGQTHAQCCAIHPLAELVVIADVEADKRKQAAEEWQVATCETLGEVLDVGVDMVAICLPTYLHADGAVAALKAGKHVLCEKPMARTVEQAEAMVRAANEAGRYLMIGQVLRFWPEYEFLKEAHDQQTHGALLSFTGMRGGGAPLWTWQDWMSDPEKSGGAALDLHIHDTDFILHLLGSPRSVTSHGVTGSHGVEHIVTRYDYGGPVVFAEGLWSYGGASFPFRMLYRAVFEKAAVEYSLQQKPTLAVYQTGKEPFAPPLPEPPPAKGVPKVGNVQELSGYYREVDYFLNCIAQGKPPSRVTPEDGKRSVEVVLAEIRSAATGTTVTL